MATTNDPPVYRVSDQNRITARLRYHPADRPSEELAVISLPVALPLPHAGDSFEFDDAGYTVKYVSWVYEPWNDGAPVALNLPPTMRVRVTIGLR